MQVNSRMNLKCGEHKQLAIKIETHNEYVTKFVCLFLPNGTSALFRPLVPRIVEVEHMRHVNNDL